MSADAIVARSSSKPTGFLSLMGERWLVLCLATLLTAAAFLYGAGHAHALPPDGGQDIVKHAQQEEGLRHGHPVPCDDQGSDDSDCCFSGPQCGVCAPMPSGGLTATANSGSVGAIVFPASAPAEIQFHLRPPQLSVTA